MLLPRFDYHEPRAIDEACQLMKELGAKAKPIAGGTDLIVNMKKGVVSPEHIVSLTRIGELKGVKTSNGRISIGACATAAELEGSNEIQKTAGVIAQAAGSLGSPLIRNLATIAGNLVTARPAADFPPALLALSAEVVLRSASGERVVPLDDFFLGPGQTVMKQEEILTNIMADVMPANAGASWVKLGVRKSLEISLVNVAAYISLDRSGTIEGARVVLGSVAPMPIRALSAEKVLIGEKPTEELFARAGEAARSDSKPIDDFRASAEYKRDMVQVLTRRTLGEAHKKACA